MRLKSLKASGFKSFCHPVELEFQQNGITIVVGPNGCGKSNVVDAIRWVLGEQRARHLRGGAMEDVIFAGSAFQKPSGVAEVTLTFLNPQGDTLRQYHEYTEIAVTRRLYRSGESAYLINKTPVRLMDIRELFMDTGVGGTGYSIVEQGRVGEMVSAKPSERRTLIDDAAGIIKFRTKRQTAERRLEETQQNLLRVNDLLNELKDQEEALRDQVEKARIYLDLQQRSAALELHHTLLQWTQAEAQETQTQQTLSNMEQQQQAQQTEKEVLEIRLQQVSLEQVQRGTRLSEKREALHQQERRIQEAENQRALEQQSMANLREQQAQRDTERHTLTQRAQELDVEQQTAVAQAEHLSDQEGQLREEIEAVEATRLGETEALQEAQQQLQAAQRDLLRLHTDLTNQTNQRGFLGERLEQQEGRRLQLHTQQQTGETLLLTLQQQRQEQQTRLEAQQQRQEALEQQRDDLDAQLAEQATQVTQAETQLREQQIQLDSKRSRLQSLQQIQLQHEGFGDSTRAFLEQLEQHPEAAEALGVVGLLADTVEAHPEALEAVAPVLAEMLDWVLVRSTQNLPALERFCQQHQLGRLNVVPLDLIPPSSTELGPSVAPQLRFAESVRSWAEAFFGNIHPTPAEWDALPQSLEATAHWVNTAGSFWFANSLRLGKLQESALGVLKRQQEVRELEEATLHLEEALDGQRQILDTLRDQQEALSAQREEVLGQFRTLELDGLAYRKELEHTEIELRRAEHARREVLQDLERLGQEVENLKQRRAEVEVKLEELEAARQSREAQVEVHQQQIEAQSQRMEALSENLTEKRVRRSELQEQLRGLNATQQRVEREQETTRQRLAQLEANQTLEAQRLKTSRQRIEDIDASFGPLLQTRQDLQAELAEESRQHAAQDVVQEELRDQLRGQQGRLEDTNRQFNAASIKLTEFRMQRTQWEEKIAELSESPLEELRKQVPDNAQDFQEMSREIRSLRARMNAMGAVNLTAPEEHATLLERLGFIATQSGDLQQAVEDLKSTIHDINRESRKRFREMFEQINIKFGELFSSLFGGGEARMVLTESEDLLEAGVEIVAQPPGKKLQNLNLLSGGEKALTAISLIFAIFLIKPSPFCLLDEVDAPLDDANVSRFNRLIQKLTDNAQFIIITHNKKTMEIGQRLYGITMEEPGISKTVSVRFQEAEQLVD